MTRPLFRGGVHPPEAKETTRDAATADAPAPARVTVPFSQHIGKPAAPVVKPGERVLRGQLIAADAGFVSAAIHAPVSGTVKAVVKTRHPVGFLVDALEIENDFADEWHPEIRDRAPDEAAALQPDDIRRIVHDAGIVGMGGATFPSHVKLTVPAGKTIDAFVINGAECEPFLSCDHRLMLEQPEGIVEGIGLFLRALGAKRALVGVEANKPGAVAALDAAIARRGWGDSVATRPLPVRYPQGAEKQLIKALLGREVPSGGLPADAGVVVHNVGSVFAGYEACLRRRPLTERIVTVAGPCVARPGNWRVRVGMSAKELLEAGGADFGRIRRLLVGGPMMGLPQRDADFYVAKGVTGLVALDTEPPNGFGPCFRCARCVDGCPAGLLPCDLSVLGEREHWLAAEEHHAMDCIECGTCAYVCPAKRPIVQWIRLEKAAIGDERRKRAAAAPQA